MNNKISVDLVSMEDMISSGCFDIDLVTSIISKALIDYKNGYIDLPDKISQIFNEETQDRINCMPATLKNERVCGVKWVSVFPNNPIKYSIPNVSGTIILSEIEKGLPFAIMDGTFITAVRTACMGALAAKNLAKKNSKVFGSIGAGEQAKMHFVAIKHFFPNIKKCYVASYRSFEEDSFVDVLSKKYPDVEFVKCNSDYGMASKEADIIVTAVSCQKPLLRSDSIKKGAFYCHVGGWEDEYSVPLMADKIICDNWNALKHRGSPTIARLYKMGKLSDEDIYCNLADVLDGTKLSRENDDEFIYFNSIGLAFIDMAVALSFYKKCKSKTKWIMKDSDLFGGLIKQ